ncbi:MAG TPA: dienelactone hydrolase family protein [Polyangiaceae bacterium]|jgi:carboxymethylenebutenolidase|nr:dienelactone hydrolase family protein [Polyangiaceae bacterium]
MIVEESVVQLSTNSGVMQTHVTRPVAAGKRPGVVLFSEIFQRTGPIRRMSALLAGQGMVVLVPEIFHELEPVGSVLPYDAAGTERGNQHKTNKPTSAYDDDARACLDHLLTRDDCDGRLGTVGVCIGGHLAFRSAFDPRVRAAACFYATDIHKGSLGLGGDDSLARAGEISGELLMVWGRQDPHVPDEGRARIQARLLETKRRFTWHEWNAAHAFLRDEGPRYDPALALISYRMITDLLLGM